MSDGKEKYALVGSLLMDYNAGGNIPDILENMWNVRIKTGAQEVQANLNGVRVIMIDECLFKILGGVKCKS